ncbi:barwin-like endoglucanase [Dichomitus squalens]|uniref:Barwin-like endoglucanase n=2 Tax=Dichomitus squalens TaxID=114155 RepID=A0A4Q9MBC9_9APHY|nr:barwin-like endoglucanase [Dichomitus squalens LYAD-421 SS1]EJF58907.1 barwin-like endoglucanase [Dichomitus squalens LYAD-421 SS1]TBU24560.1 barwin-like endoglucanase [Dichomitus squalens]TBU37287.1 barwin-like endoglucanase [Dichomitus squalens]TBU53897.1 barwin-like endoglucanase [Dichomitus squalens]
MRFTAVVLAALSAATAGFAQSLSMSGGDATFYTPGLGSCGFFNTEADFIVAVDIATIQSFPGATANPNANPMCGRQMVVTGPDGKTVTVTVADTCPGCAPGSVDLTPTAFQQLASLDVGRLHGISWTLV